MLRKGVETFAAPLYGGCPKREPRRQLVPEYTSRPNQKAARRAWDYFAKKHPAGRRTVTLGYSPNVDGYGPGWIWQLGSLEIDTLHWKGGDMLLFNALCGSIRD